MVPTTQLSQNTCLLWTKSSTLFIFCCPCAHKSWWPAWRRKMPTMDGQLFLYLSWFTLSGKAKQHNWKVFLFICPSCVWEHCHSPRRLPLTHTRIQFSEWNCSTLSQFQMLETFPKYTLWWCTAGQGRTAQQKYDSMRTWHPARCDSTLNTHKRRLKISLSLTLCLSLRRYTKVVTLWLLDCRRMSWDLELQ